MSNDARRPRIAIVGAGIGGLTLALALRGHGIDCTLYESATELREVGAAVGLAANAMRFYDSRLGLGDLFRAKSFEIEGLIYRDGRTGQVIGSHRDAAEYRRRYGASFFGIYRPDMQVILSTAVGLDRIHLGRRLVSIDDGGEAAVLHFEDGSTAEADLVVGADGARSAVRRQLLGYDDALYSGCSGFRGVVHADQLGELPDKDALQFWIGPEGHALHYPIGNDLHNFLLVERGPAPWPGRDWTLPAAEGEQLARFGDWHPAVVQMITAVPLSQRWGLFHRPPLGRWTRGRVTLLGDAAHALVPHHGQGANQTIEDAIVLADQLAVRSDPAGACTEYERLRKGRTRKVQYASITVADVLHQPPGPTRDEAYARLGSPQLFDRHMSWIHGFVADGAEPDDAGGGTWL